MIPVAGPIDGPLGILAGGGPLPGRVAASAARAGRDVFIVAFQDFAEPDVVRPWPHEFIRLAAAGRILSALRAHRCTELVLIGPVRRPSLRDLRPDAEGTRILARIGRALFAGDDGLLAALVRVLGEEGFQVRGAHEFLPGSVGGPGRLGRHAPDREAQADIERGVAVVQALGRLDVGQGCVVQNGLVLAVEALEGTDRMLERAGPLRQPGPGGVLVKLVKPGQDRRADLPTIGPRTVAAARAAGLRGIAFEAGGTLLTDPDRLRDAADRDGLFLIGIDPADGFTGEDRMGSYLHTMVRVKSLDQSLAFYRLLGLRELRRSEVPAGKYTLVFVGYDDNAHGQAEIELTYNWGQDDGYEVGSGFGHFAVGVPNVAEAVEQVRAGGGKVTREAGPVKHGTTVIAFVEDPDGYKIELIQR